MREIKVTAFKMLTQDAVASYTNNVITLMTADPQFANLNKEVAALKTSYEAYATALSNNVNGGRLTTIEKNKCRQDLNNQLSKTALLVDLLADGQESVILAAGFDVRKPATSYTFLEVPTVIKIENQKEPGLVTVELGKVEGATNYGIEKRVKIDGQPDTPWTNGEYSSACKAKLSGLTSGNTYEWRFRALGNKGLVSGWSAPVSVLVS